MNKKIIIIMTLLMIVISSISVCFANTDLKIKEKQSMVDYKTADEFYNSILKKITDENVEYELLKVDRMDNFKRLTVEKEVIDEIETNTNELEQVTKLFNENKNYTEDGYTGNLVRDNSTLKVSIKDSYQEEYKVYIQRSYENVLSNELNEIPKEINQSGTIYYLINPLWDIAETEEVDNNNVPIRYNGTMYYEGIKTKTIVTSYIASIKYVGTLEKQVLDTTTFNIQYKEIKKDNNIIPLSLVTGGGIVFFSGIIYFGLKNVKIYNKQNGKYKLIKRLHLKDKNDNINLTPTKAETRCYKIVLSNSLYKQTKNKIITIKYFDKIYNYQVIDKNFEINV